MYRVETITELQTRAIAWGPIGVERTVDPQECHDQFLAEHGDFCTIDATGGQSAKGEHWDAELVIEYPIRELTDNYQDMSIL
jgi:hypothetical protein